MATTVSESAGIGGETFQFAPFNTVPVFCPRIWHGMVRRHWWQLMAENRYQIDRSRWPMAICACGATVVPPLLNGIQTLLFGRRAAETALVQDPLFVIGHWRSGTTLLHELLTQDRRFAFPTTFQCFAPRSFLISQSWLRPMTSLLLPKRRPMDNMDMGWDVPQEDEFALMTMGLPTPYRRIAFPNNPPRHLDYLNMSGIPANELARWQRALRDFIQNLNYHYRKPLVLKSPPHTGRIRILLEMFPRAKFVHLTRHPLKFIPSTMHLWAALDFTNGLQIPQHQNLREYVFLCFERLYRGFYRDHHLLGTNNLITVRFDDLVREPVNEMRRIYRQLDLGDFERVIPQIRRRLELSQAYQPNAHPLPQDLSREIRERCAEYLHEFGYSAEHAATR